MKPKLLPWLANKSGLTLQQVEALWEEAIRYATAEVDRTDGAVGSSRYWAAANRRLLELVRAAALDSRPRGLTPWVRLQARIGLVPVLATTRLMLLWQSGRHRFAARQTGVTV